VRWRFVVVKRLALWFRCCAQRHIARGGTSGGCRRCR
jgi:hypothetical protein